MPIPLFRLIPIASGKERMVTPVPSAAGASPRPTEGSPGSSVSVGDGSPVPEIYKKIPRPVGSFLCKCVVAQMKCRNMERHLEDDETEAADASGNEAQRVVAFIVSQPLDGPVHGHGNCHQKSGPQREPAKATEYHTREDTDQHPGASGTDREPLSTPVERTVIPAMTAEDDRQPFIEPGTQAVTYRQRCR